MTHESYLRKGVTLLRGPNFPLTHQGLCSTCNACMTSPVRV